MIESYLATFDFNMPLIDAVNDGDLPGVRSELSALTLGEGLDSGYYEARELAGAMGGTLAVTSREGVGTRFRLTLPAGQSLEDAA